MNQVVEFIEAERAEHPISQMCKVLNVSRAAFYKTCERMKNPSKRKASDAALSQEIKLVHQNSKGCYGARRIYKALKNMNRKCSRKRVERLMRENGIVGKHRRKKTITTIPRDVAGQDLIQRDFDSVSEPNRRWVSDITYISTWAGFVYLCVFIDLATRKVVGWALDDNMETSLVIRALSNAIERQRPRPGLMVHSDQGAQYTSRRFRSFLDNHNFLQSLSRRAQCWDNAVCESWFGTLKNELIEERSWRNLEHVRSEILPYIEIFYNRQRLHSTLSYLTPQQCEDRFNQQNESEGDCTSLVS